MSTRNKRILLLLTTIYAFFTCFILNVFGWALSYEQLTYDWKILNIREGRKVVFNYAIFHFVLFAICVFIYVKPGSKKGQFSPLKASESNLEQQVRNQIDH